MEQLPVETTLYSMSDQTPGARNRRSGERHLALFRVGSLLTGDRRELCLVKNISAGGALIRAYSDLQQDQKVELELKERQAIPGAISWVRGADAGIEFASKIDVIELLSAGSEGLRPRMPRIEISAFGFIRQGALLHRAVVNNISQGGMSAQCNADLKVDGEVTVSLPGLAPQHAVVRWGQSGSYGITFNNVLGLPILVEWLQSQAVEPASRTQSPSV